MPGRLRGHPGLPIVVFGHSMGSFMTQQFISEHGDALAGAVLSGSDGAPPDSARLGLWLARLERLRVGPRGKSPIMKKLVFGGFNKPFEPARTPFYRAAGLENVRHHFYLRGRHESLNESNRDEVTRDLIRWLNSVVASAGRVVIAPSHV